MPPSSSQTLENMDVVQKANLVLADLTTAGKLNPEQSKEFIKTAIIGSKFLGMATVQPMNGPSREINKIRFESRILQAGKGGTALAAAANVKPTLSKTTLTTVLAKGTVRVEDEVFDDNVEQEALRSTIMGLIAEKVGADLEELALIGDTASADPFIALLDGLIKQATSNPLPGASAKLSKAICRDMFKLMPREFRKDKSKLAFITSSDAQVDYVDSLADRITVGGDSALEQGRTAPTWSGIPIEDVPLFPNNLGSGNDETVVILADPKNATVGIQREIRVEVVRDAEAGTTNFVVTVRADAKWAHEPAVVKSTAIKS